ncbi:MAG: hypothetical protein CME93_07245 [Hyphomonadaceae bacterium]|nr:hypothetical protein [Hyphomonadaceae bacterium]
MWQRIQTLYMSVVVLLAVCLLFLFEVGVDANGVILLGKDIVLVFFESVLTMLIVIVAIVQFKNRQNQFVLNRVAILIQFFLLGFFVYRALSMPGEGLTSEKGIGAFVPIVSIVLLALANRAIKKDEDLVKSVDRIR